MCDCATELEKKRQELQNKASLKSLSRVSSCCSFCSGPDDEDSPGLLRAFMMFLRGEISWSEVAQAAGFSGNVGMIGAMVGGGVLLAMLTVMSKFHGESSWNFHWRKPPPRNCIPKRSADEGPPRIDKKRMRWPPEEDEN
ncbi:uncharacterized protein [Choristoneura fumiferana]|uniref:uncharacterized protein n=1 Tax=Choristoneura fumiferana TaxID=7141 RepID=UPI003D15C368